MQILRKYILNEYKSDLMLRHLLKHYSIQQIVEEIMFLMKEKKMHFIETTLFARDIYIGSDWQQNEKENYQEELTIAGFFDELNTFLYHPKRAFQEWAIYTFGKFSITKNLPYLERAYSEAFRAKDLFLSYRCLFEISWLDSKMLDSYLNELKTRETPEAQLTLLYFYQSNQNYEKDFQKMAQMESIQSFFCLNLSGNPIEELDDKLFQLEMHFNKKLFKKPVRKYSNEDYLDFVKEYFETN